MNYFEAHGMVSSKEVDSKVRRMAIHVMNLFMIKRQNGECNGRHFRQFLFGFSPDVMAFKVPVFTCDIKF